MTGIGGKFRRSDCLDMGRVVFLDFQAQRGNLLAELIDGADLVHAYHAARQHQPAADRAGPFLTDAVGVEDAEQRTQ